MLVLPVTFTLRQATSCCPADRSRYGSRHQKASAPAAPQDAPTPSPERCLSAQALASSSPRLKRSPEAAPASKPLRLRCAAQYERSCPPPDLPPSEAWSLTTLFARESRRLQHSTLRRSKHPPPNPDS